MIILALKISKMREIRKRCGNSRSRWCKYGLGPPGLHILLLTLTLYQDVLQRKTSYVRQNCLKRVYFLVKYPDILTITYCIIIKDYYCPFNKESCCKLKTFLVDSFPRSYYFTFHFDFLHGDDNIFHYNDKFLLSHS